MVYRGIVRTPPFFKGGKYILITYIFIQFEQLKGVGSMVQGQVFLKGREELTLFLFHSFKVYHFYIQKLLFPLQNCVMHSGFYPSTFLQPVNGIKSSILYQVFKLNLFKSLQAFLLYVCLEKPQRGFFFYTIVFALISLKYLQTNQVNYSIRSSTKKSLQLRSKNQKQTCWWSRCCFFLVWCV